ncbi:hypothetical protein R3X27_18375 [Tropicimonas sp. TH_r6]|uniref:tripartite tricarboxylate transporter TctB family protein n=1 Tax=Tropicimonas sp. TH_r6 TaxID=3082085 RepID=UPI0029551DBB|nr:tripartite tricarboxylate transporter TctB family protein [Tropicimonas sp. TH_r6]MDV7144650.1 hypothetical protein [Tropicimonas sp. TH_r6]
MLVLLAASAFHIAGDYGDGTRSGGDVFPRMTAGAVCATGLLALFLPSPATERPTISPKSLRILALTLAFLGLMPSIGYPLVAPLWIGGAMWVFGLRNPFLLLSIALGLSATAWIMLSRLAFAPPPAGLFEALF